MVEAKKMSILKETAISVPALAVLVFVSHAYFGSEDSQPISTPTSWLGAVTIPAERLIAKDLITGRASKARDESSLSEEAPPSELTPQARIRGVFSQFGANSLRSAS
jgi:hypothetical protein